MHQAHITHKNINQVLHLLDSGGMMAVDTYVDPVR